MASDLCTYLKKLSLLGMRKWLSKPYPFLLQDTTVRLKIALFVFIFVFTFLSVFQPFNLAEVVEMNIYLAAFIYAATSAIVAWIVVTIMVALFPNFANEENWDIGKEVLMLISVLLIISVANFFIGNVFGFHEMEGLSYWECALVDVSRTFAIGIFPVTVITFINHTVMLKRNLNKAKELNTTLNNREAEIFVEVPIQMNITSPAKNNDIDLKLDDLLYVMADGNYVEFHFFINGEVKREIRRNTLNNIASQLSGVDFIFRSHRAYMVNLNKIIESKGNAQGYQLKLQSVEQWVPVSRGNLSAFDEKIRSNIELLEQLHA